MLNEERDREIEREREREREGKVRIYIFFYVTVTELMANGALLSYLRKPVTKEDLTFKDQIDIGAQCADGMAYLELNVNIHIFIIYYFRAGVVGHIQLADCLFQFPFLSSFINSASYTLLSLSSLLYLSLQYVEPCL